MICNIKKSLPDSGTRSEQKTGHSASGAPPHGKAHVFVIEPMIDIATKMSSWRFINFIKLCDYGVGAAGGDPGAP
jgi:hypothetical protein